MKIACWSPVRGDICGYFTGLFATVCALEFPCKVVALDNYVKEHNLGHCFLGSRYDALCRDYRAYEAGTHFGDAFLEFVSRCTSRRIRNRRCLEIVEERLFFLPNNQSLPKQYYDYGIDSEYDEIAAFCETHYDFTVWNIESNQNVATSTILEDADVILAVVPNDEEAINRVLHTCRGELSKVRLVIIGREGSERRLKRLRRNMYTEKHLSREQIHILVMTDVFWGAAEEGSIVNYVIRGMETDRRSKEYEFLKGLKSIAFEVTRREYGRLLSFGEVQHFLYRRNHEEVLPNLYGGMAYAK